MFSLQYLLLLTEVLFTVLFIDSVFTVHYYVNTVQVLFTDYKPIGPMARKSVQGRLLYHL